MRTRRQKAIHQSPEALESRQVLAAGITAALNSGVIEIRGTEAADSIRVSQTTSSITVQDAASGRNVLSVAPRDAQSIVAWGFGGDDTIDLRGNGNPVLVKSRIYGGMGNDKLYGGNNSDIIAGDLDDNGDRWSILDGSARDIAVGADGSAWVIGTNRVTGGYGIYRRVGDSWSSVDGGASRIAVDPAGNPWVVNDAGSIYQRVSGQWIRRPGSATDIAIGANGQVWVIGTDGQNGGFGIHRWTGSSWTRVDGGGVRIAVDSVGNPWVVNNQGAIYRREGSQWKMMSGKATDIAIGGNGQVWVIGTDGQGGGFGIHRWNGTGWTQRPGGGTQIAVDPQGLPWVVNNAGAIYRHDTAGNDLLLGGPGDDELYGGDGTDSLFGEVGMDWLDAGSASESVDGGKDTDWNAQVWAIGGTAPEDVDQEGSNTCVLLASLASISRTQSLTDRITYLGNHMYQVRMYEGLSAVVENVWFDGKMTTFGSSTVDPKSVTEGEFWTIVFQRAYLQHFESIQTDPTTGKQHRISFRNAADVATTGFAVSLFKVSRALEAAIVLLWPSGGRLPPRR